MLYYKVLILYQTYTSDGKREGLSKTSEDDDDDDGNKNNNNVDNNNNNNHTKPIAIYTYIIFITCVCAPQQYK